MENVLENYRRIADSLDFRRENIVRVEQRHTDKIIAVNEEMLTASRDIIRLSDEADALVTDIKGVVLSVRTADCVPILMHDPENRAIAAIHAGWRGTFAQIAPKTIRRMTALYGTNPANLQVAIGPAIGRCCYEVSHEIFEDFLAKHGNKIKDFFTFPSNGKPKCDLKAMNAAFIAETGVLNISTSPLCTRCNPRLFFSHRRSNEKRGTMSAFIGLR